MDEHDQKFDPDEIWEEEIPGVHWVILPIAVALILALLMGCSTIDPNNRVEGWPELQVVENKVSFDEVQEKCRPYVGWGQWPMACALYYLQTANCVIYYAFDWSLEHERAHCKGYDHPGSNDMRAMLKNWNSRAAR